jgi:DNA-directed RNA polymerase subunit beta
LEFEADANDVIWVKVDRTRKIPVTVLLRAIGYGTVNEIMELYDGDARILNTLEKDHTDSQDDGLLEIYKRLRPGEPLNVENARNLLNRFFSIPGAMILPELGVIRLIKSLL